MYNYKNSYTFVERKTKYYINRVAAIKMEKLTNKEEEIMHILWKLEKAFVKDVLAEIKEDKPHYNTLSTIIRNLDNYGSLSTVSTNYYVNAEIEITDNFRVDFGARHEEAEMTTYNEDMDAFWNKTNVLPDGIGNNILADDDRDYNRNGNVYTGNVKRAPKLFRTTNLEWLYRLSSQPSRLFRQSNLLKYIYF